MRPFTGLLAAAGSNLTGWSLFPGRTVCGMVWPFPTADAQKRVPPRGGRTGRGRFRVTLCVGGFPGCGSLGELAPPPLPGRTVCGRVWPFPTADAQKRVPPRGGRTGRGALPRDLVGGGISGMRLARRARPTTAAGRIRLRRKFAGHEFARCCRGADAPPSKQLRVSYARLRQNSAPRPKRDSRTRQATKQMP